MNERINLKQNPVFLVSGRSPGCGSSTLAESLKERVETVTGKPVYYKSMGKMVREKIGVDNEADMQQGLDKVKALRHLDSQIYKELPDDQIVIVDGKLATTEGPIHIDPSRPLVSIDLHAPSLISAQRVLQREGVKLSDNGHFSDKLITNYHSVVRRGQHDLAMRTSNAGESQSNTVEHFIFDSGRLAVPEMVDTIFENEATNRRPPHWEIDALKETYNQLRKLRFMNEDTLREENKVHLDHQLESIKYGISRLQSTSNSKGLSLIRDDLKSSFVDCWYGIMMPNMPRFRWQKDEQGEEQLEADTQSQKWSPEFYKIAEGWPTIRAYLKDKTVLDPFAGPGAMMNLLVARGIVKKAFYSDLFYSSMNEEGRRYDPQLNTEAGLLLFESLPSWYKPDISAIKGYIAADSRKLPFQDEAVDFVFGDPPYGKNHDGPGIGVLFGSINELKRVSKEGAILMVPMDWIKEIRAGGHEVEQLTEDLSRGKSNLPVCYIHIKK
jgi:cytidylate kinase